MSCTRARKGPSSDRDNGRKNAQCRAFSSREQHGQPIHGLSDGCMTYMLKQRFYVGISYFHGPEEEHGTDWTFIACIIVMLN